MNHREKLIAQGFIKPAKKSTTNISNSTKNQDRPSAVRNYRCNVCAEIFANIIDLNYHWLDCGRKTQEDENYEWLKKNKFNEISSPSSIKSKSSKKQSILKKIIHKVESISNSVRYEKTWQCEICGKSFQLKTLFDSHRISCLKKIKDKKKNHSDLVFMKNPILQFQSTKITKTQVDSEKILNSKESEVTIRLEKSRIQKNQPQKTLPRIKTTLLEAKCSCEGENENCFKCNGTGFYTKKIITNIEECQDKIQEKRTRITNSIQESQFSNDQRGGIYGVREKGRFSSNPLYEEDI